MAGTARKKMRRMSDEVLAPAGNQPWLVAVWPGMGQVALTAGYYLMAKLRMHEADPLSGEGLFDAEYVQVHEGIVRTAHLPENRVFLWKDPADRHDIVVLIGEAQPPAGKLAFCSHLLDYAERLGVKEVFTFAAVASDMHPHKSSRVLGVATHPEEREKIRRSGVEVMPDGRIAGLNGILLGAVSQRGMRGIGLLGEMPAFAAQVPYPNASAAVLSVFTQMAGISLDLGELEEYGRSMENQLSEVLEKLKEAIGQASEEEESSGEGGPPVEEPPETAVTPEDRVKIERLFDDAQRERAKTFELKRELDRLGLFKIYEDRFLDLFKRR
jgi:proteasome assembly chaperone (PAC2) family protein